MSKTKRSYEKGILDESFHRDKIYKSRTLQEIEGYEEQLVINIDSVKSASILFFLIIVLFEKVEMRPV
jgi:hypothetical protein